MINNINPNIKKLIDAGQNKLAYKLLLNAGYTPIQSISIANNYNVCWTIETLPSGVLSGNLEEAFYVYGNIINRILIERDLFVMKIDGIYLVIYTIGSFVYIEILSGIELIHKTSETTPIEVINTPVEVIPKSDTHDGFMLIHPQTKEIIISVTEGFSETQHTYNMIYNLNEKYKLK